MVGHRLGEFSLTRTFRGHGRVTKRLVQKHNYMEKIAHIKYIRITPKKLRTILDDVRGKRVLEVLAQLAVTQNVPLILQNAIKSCLAQIDVKEHAEVRVKRIVAQDGPRFKRFSTRRSRRSTPPIERKHHI